MMLRKCVSAPVDRPRPADRDPFGPYMTSYNRDYIPREAITHAYRFVTSLFFFTTRKRSLRRLCFYRCLFVHRGRAWHTFPGHAHPPGMHAPWHAPPWVRMPPWHAPPQRILQDAVNERAVRILLESILVISFSQLRCILNFTFSEGKSENENTFHLFDVKFFALPSEFMILS